MDWIKVEKNTPDKPEILKAAADCGVEPETAYTGWFRLWAWFDSVTADGHVPHVKPENLDRIAGVPGLSASFASSGWLEFSQDGVLVINWARHNGKNAKQRALHTANQAEQRAKGRDNGYRPWKR